MIPKLRFSQFTDEWKIKKLDRLIQAIESGVSVNSDDREKCNGEKGILKTSAVSKGTFCPSEHKTILPAEINRARLNPRKDSIIISRMNTPQLVGESGYVNKTYSDLFIPDRLWQITVDDQQADSKWLSYVISSDKMRMILTNISSGTSNSMKNISQPSFLNIKIATPRVNEQQKIADFLTSVDDKISAIDKKVELLKKYKNGVMQKIFSQEVRFKNKNNDYQGWNRKQLRDILRESLDKSSKNNQYELLSSTSNGLFRQSEYFKKDTSSENNSGYKILRKGQLVFSPQNIWMGNINLNREFEIGIVSPSYKIYSIIGIEPTYLESILRSSRMLYNYRRSSGQGASVVRRNLDIDSFLSIKINVPSMNEQQKIADFLTKLDDKIDLVEQRLNQAKQFKKALLQGMFA